MKRDKTHDEQIERWVRYIKEHKDWKKVHTKFINAQIEIALRARKKLNQGIN